MSGVVRDDDPASVLQIGERLLEPPSPELKSIAFAGELQAQIGLTEAISWVDLAHVISFTKAGIIPTAAATSLVASLLELSTRPASFTPRAEYGDLYTNREAWLAQRTPAAGWLGIGRARREALTTAYHLTLCDELLALGATLTAFVDCVSEASSRHRESLAPDYTYLQAAQPTTFGHYLQSFAWPALRDLGRIEALYNRVDCCPAGIGSMNGSPIAHCRQELSDRLGFREPVRHARDAMWQQDLAIEAAALAVSITINLDRLAEDLMIFATIEFGFVHLADRHARASKIQPQKRNPFALSFVRAISNRLLGVQTQIAASARTPSAQMDNRLFAYQATPEALHSANDAVRLMTECVGAMRFDEARALDALRNSSVCASDLVERLITATGLDHRWTHGVVGRLLHSLDADGRILSQVTLGELHEALKNPNMLITDVNEELLRKALDPVLCVASRDDIGGAAPTQVQTMAATLKESSQEFRQNFITKAARRRVALQQLHADANALARRA